jgi:hypothetical protein
MTIQYFIKTLGQWGKTACICSIYISEPLIVYKYVKIRKIWTLKSMGKRLLFEDYFPVDNSH